MPTPEPGPNEVRIRIAASGINPGDVKKRRDQFRVGIPYARTRGIARLAGLAVDAIEAAATPPLRRRKTRTARR